MRCPESTWAAAEAGTVAVFAVGAERAVTELGRSFVGPNAHTVAVDPATHRVYFSHREPGRATRPAGDGRRPSGPERGEGIL
ncbi:MAG: hypothetical protein M3O50_03015, partial [Myxococcota bacterium]|nr:hypothetical protein [Myxococcota bacterium]